MLRALLRSLGYPKVLCCLLTLSVSWACTNTKGLKTEELLRPVTTLHKAIKYAMKDGVKRRSENTRTYYSKFHKPGMNLHAGFKDHKERAQLVMSITGDRRPYQIVVLYKVDRLSGKKFKFHRYDKGLASKYLEKVNEYLAARPEDRDVIDDFRPY